MSQLGSISTEFSIRFRVGFDLNFGHIFDSTQRRFGPFAAQVSAFLPIEVGDRRPGNGVHPAINGCRMKWNLIAASARSMS